ncbi:MAG: hypothetical protein WCG31_01945 [Deltaproteobacteria bacterium]
MKQKLFRMTTVASVCLAGALLSACGGDSSSTGSGLYSGKTTQAAVSDVSVIALLAGITDILPSCNSTVGDLTSTASAVKTVRQVLSAITQKTVGKSVASPDKSIIPPSPPSPQTGTCGGTLTFPTYSHSSGTTTISIKWDNYCITNTRGNQVTYNGTLNAVDAGTPGAFGPVTTKLSANIPRLSIVEKTPPVPGPVVVVSNKTIALSGFVYVPTPGEIATTSPLYLPGTTTITSFEAKDYKGDKQYKLGNMNIVTTMLIGGDIQITMTGRVYEGSTGYTVMTTVTPLLMDDSQNFISGEMLFTGSASTYATCTALNEPGQDFTVSVNGTPLSGQMSCYAPYL